MFAQVWNARDIGIVKGRGRAALFDQFHQLECRAFAGVLDVLLVGDAEDQNLRIAQATAGAPIKITGYVRYALGEGIDRPETDFAAEVAATMKPN